MKNSFGLLLMGTLVWVFPAASTRGAVLTSVPMQGGMVMPMLSYDATVGALHVQVDPTVPQLIPLLASNPSDSFDPADPWFDALDPSRQGLAFSRRYGFVMNTITDPLPAGTAIWIRKLDGSPELGLFRYRGSAPKTWEPIFGTAGSPNALLWNGMMFHPAITAPPGSSTYTATFEAVLASTSTGAEVPGSSTGPFTLTWTTVPDGRPALSIAQRLIIDWPAAAANWVLECCDMGPGSQWTVVTNAPVTVDGKSAVILDATSGRLFFRMRKAQ